MIKEALKNFFETIKSLNNKTDKTQADYIRKISEENKERAEKERKEKEERHYKENYKSSKRRRIFCRNLYNYTSKFNYSF